MNWERWRPEIARAVDGVHHTIEDIDRQLAEQQLFPWFTDDCCVLLRFHQYPGSRTAQVMWAAGGIEAITAEAPAIEKFLREIGCTEVLIEGHPGWARALKSIGYGVWSVTVKKAL